MFKLIIYDDKNCHTNWWKNFENHYDPLWKRNGTYPLTIKSWNNYINHLYNGILIHNYNNDEILFYNEEDIVAFVLKWS